MSNIPLAERMRPRHLDAIIGQRHLLGPEGVLRKAVLSGKLPSMNLLGTSRSRENHTGPYDCQ